MGRAAGFIGDEPSEEVIDDGKPKAEADMSAALTAVVGSSSGPRAEGDPRRRRGGPGCTLGVAIGSRCTATGRAVRGRRHGEGSHQKTESVSCRRGVRGFIECAVGQGLEKGLVARVETEA